MALAFTLMISSSQVLATLEEHLSRLAKVLSRLENAGLRLNREKRFFLRSSVEYFGHIVEAQGIHPTPEKLAAVKDAPEPTNSTQLQSFLGLINYYNKFLPNLAAKLTPLYALLNKHQSACGVMTKNEPSNVQKTHYNLMHFSPATIRAYLSC